MPDLSILWFALTIGGPIILVLALLYGVARTRRRSGHGVQK